MTSKRMYEGGSLQGFNVVSQLYPRREGCRGFCGGGSMDSMSVAYGNGANMAAGGVLSMRWYEILWCDRRVEDRGRGFYTGVVCRGVKDIDGAHSDAVVGYVGIGADIDRECDAVVVDRVLMEWLAVMERLNGIA